jgi:hypothetical protein
MCQSYIFYYPRIKPVGQDSFFRSCSYLGGPNFTGGFCGTISNIMPFANPNNGNAVFGDDIPKTLFGSVASNPPACPVVPVASPSALPKTDTSNTKNSASGIELNTVMVSFVAVAGALLSLA